MPALETAVQHQVEQKEDTAEATSEGKKVLDAIALVDNMQDFKDRYNNDITGLIYEQDKADPESAYNKELAEALEESLGREVSPEIAQKLRLEVTRVVKEKVTVLTTEQIQRFEYVCPYCKRIESPDCHYFSQPNQFNLGWRIEKSLKKPYAVEITKEIEKEIDVERVFEVDA